MTDNESTTARSTSMMLCGLILTASCLSIVRFLAGLTHGQTVVLLILASLGVLLMTTGCIAWHVAWFARLSNKRE